MACTDEERSVDLYQSLRCNNQVVFEVVLTEYVNLILMKKLPVGNHFSTGCYILAKKETSSIRVRNNHTI